MRYDAPRIDSEKIKQQIESNRRRQQPAFEQGYLPSEVKELKPEPLLAQEAEPEAAAGGANPFFRVPSFDQVKGGVNYLLDNSAGGMLGMAGRKKPEAGPPRELYTTPEVVNSTPDKAKPRGSVSAETRSSKSSKTGGGNGGLSGGGMSLAGLPPRVADVAEAGEAGALPEHEQTAYNNLKKKIQAHKTGIDLSPLMALSDTWFGGNQAAHYKAPMSEDEQGLKLAEVDMTQAKRRTELDSARLNREAKYKAVLDKLQYQKTKDKDSKDRWQKDYSLKQAKLTAYRNGKAGATKPSLSGNPYVDLAGKDKTFSKVVAKHTTEGQPADVVKALITVGAAAKNLEAEGVPPDEAARSALLRYSADGYGKSSGKKVPTPNEDWVDRLFAQASTYLQPDEASDDVLLEDDD